MSWSRYFPRRVSEPNTRARSPFSESCCLSSGPKAASIATVVAEGPLGPLLKRRKRLGWQGESQACAASQARRCLWGATGCFWRMDNAVSPGGCRGVSTRTHEGVSGCRLRRLRRSAEPSEPKLGRLRLLRQIKDPVECSLRKLRPDGGDDRRRRVRGGLMGSDRERHGPTTRASVDQAARGMTEYANATKAAAKGLHLKTWPPNR